ncbi:MAG: cbb3-type cytochrome c oxidase subunit 3 [Pseudomonadota bacterium]|nr:cbb3-type cytochrome c oxidase subunit 3 [Pseudomonadota bacterium]
MNAVTLQVIATVLAFVAFIGVCWWAYSPANRKRFEQDADIAIQTDPLNKQSNPSDIESREKPQ